MRKKPEDLVDADVSLHPNRTTQEGMKAELERTVDSIIEAWHLRVDAQKDLLRFPDVIGKKFDEVFAKYNPPEKFPVEYTDFRTINPLLTVYKRRIQEHMKNICGDEGVRTNWDPTKFENDNKPGTSGNRGGGEEFNYSGDGPTFDVAEEDASRYAVLWSETNQRLWYDKLTLFQDRDDHKKESNDPTPLQAYMLQQDLWVLDAMFKVIRELNGDSNATDTSAIKEIDHIGIGREGREKSCRVTCGRCSVRR